MSLKLFRNTQFAQSSLSSHTRESLAMHPVGLVLLASAWMAILGNLALWQTLLQLPSAGLWQVALRCVVLALQITLALSALLALLNWRWLLKPAILLLLVITALAAMSMGGGVSQIDPASMDTMLRGGFKAWVARLDPNWILSALALIVVPMIWMLPTPLRRIGLARLALANLALLLVSVLLLVGSAWLFVEQNRALMQIHPVLYEQVNPLASLWALAQMVWSAFAPG